MTQSILQYLNAADELLMNLASHYAAQSPQDIQV